VVHDDDLASALEERRALDAADAGQPRGGLGRRQAQRFVRRAL